MRPLLFRLPPERAQSLADFTLRAWPIWRAAAHLSHRSPPSLRTSVAGLELGNPIGLAAGYDKDCTVLPALSSLGFGYLTCGTVTREPRRGNPGVRLLREPDRGALINSLGFPGHGLDAAARTIHRDRPKLASTPVVVSVSGTDVDDIVECHRRLEPLVDAVEVNISSPNTAGLRRFHDTGVLNELLDAVGAHRFKPLFVKMPPFPAPQDGPKPHDLALALAETCAGRGVDALTVANTQPVTDAGLGVGVGGLSGRPIRDQMLRMVTEVRERVGDSTAINACGGVATASDAWRALEAGADTVQLLTGLVYRGPGIARDVSQGLAALLERHGLDTIEDIKRTG